MVKKRLIAFMIILFLLGIFSYFYPQIQELTGQAISSGAENNREEAILVRVVDGDTIHALVNGRDWTIRMLGINTPEKKMPFADAGKDYLNGFVNKTIYLESDFEDSDKYNRKLRYIYYGDQMLNLEIVSKGFANAYMTSGILYEKDFLDAEKSAREKGIGIWTKSSEECASCIVLVKLDAQKEFFTLKNNCEFFCSLEGWFAKDTGRNVFYLNSIESKKQETYNSTLLGKEVWNNDHDNLFVFDNQGFLVLFYEY